jgi:hypothetical protein
MREDLEKTTPAEFVRDARAELASRGWRFDEKQSRSFFGRRYWLVIATLGEQCVIGKARDEVGAWQAIKELTRAP